MPDPLSRFVALLPEPACFADGDGRVLVANDAFAALAGVAAGALRGLPLHTLVADGADKVDEFLRRAARSRQLVPGAFRWLRGDGAPAVEMRCDGAVLEPRTDATPAVLFVRGRPKDEGTDRFALLTRKIEALTQEILERRRLQHERDELLAREREARASAEHLSRLKDEFLATLSHELRTPLNAILGWSHVLTLQGGGQELARGLETIERNARAQARIIDDLLDMSRIVAGKIRLDVQQVALAPLIQGVVDSLQPAADGKSLRLRVTLDPIAGPVKGDPNRLQQVVWNLLANAIKFTPKGGRVQVFLERVNSHVEITVADTGEGIAPEFLDRVFDRFRQADASTTRRHGGLGLGLSIVRQLVELHGGSVRAKSPGLGQGATFVVMLPVAPVHDATGESGRYRLHPAASARPEIALPARALDGLAVLVVDDEPDARELLRALLAAEGAAVATAGSVAEALDRVQAEPPRVVLCDLGMPQQDGYDFVRALRALSDDRLRRIPTLAVTAFARAEDRTRALLAGFNGHLAKPVEPVELVAVVASLAGRVGGAHPE